MQEKPSAVQAAEMRRRRILGNESDRMEKLTGNKQTQPVPYPSINFGMGDIDIDALKKTIPMIKLRIKCSIKLAILLLTSLLGVFVRFYESEHNNFIFRFIKTIVNLIVAIPPIPLISNIWTNNNDFRMKTVKMVTWSMVILFIMIKAPAPPLNVPNNNLGQEMNPNPEIFQIPKEVKDILLSIGEWISALLLFFFAGYDLTHNFIV